MERVARRHRAIGQGRGEDAREAGGDPGRVALGKCDLDRLLAGVVPAEERGAILVRDESEQAVGRRFGRRCPVRARTEDRDADKDQDGGPNATEAARGTVWPDRGKHRRGKCATPMPALIAR